MTNDQSRFSVLHHEGEAPIKMWTNALPRPIADTLFSHHSEVFQRRIPNLDRWDLTDKGVVLYRILTKPLSGALQLSERHIIGRVTWDSID